MQVVIAELAKRIGVLPGQVEGVLRDLGIDHDGKAFEADEDTVSLITDELKGLAGSKEIAIPHGATSRDVAQLLGVPQPEIQKTLITKLKTMATATTSLKDDVVEKLFAEFGYSVRFDQGEKPAAPKPKVAPAKTDGAITRPPVVTILGHVDHGKTSLLDYIRKANVAAKEAGGITQHIGAYQVELAEGKITFLDTPGHAAFTAMRARGAQVTDIAILVVAGDDGIMPQTIEAINHVRNANVPMIVAINKMDKPGANSNRVLQQLTEHEVIAIQFGGQTETAEVSALTGAGVPDLLELILLQAGIMDLKADPKGELSAVVIEAKVDRGRGPVATLLIQNGTLKVGDSIIVGNTYGRIKAMTDHRGQALKEAGPSTPVEILGLSEVPGAGDKVEPAKDERSARVVADERAEQDRIRNLAGPRKKRTLKDLKAQLLATEDKILNLVVKADVQGSVEAVKGLLDKIENEEVEVKVIHAAVGPVTESDILLASAADAIVVGFNSKPEGNAKAAAEKNKVEIRTYSIIYELVEDIEAAVKGMLAPKFEENYLGTVEVRVVFKLTKQGYVAGCHVTEGKVTRGCECRVKRDREIVWQGKISTLKNVKQDAREMIAGQDCGITFDGWTDFKEGDVIEAYEMIQID